MFTTLNFWLWVAQIVLAALYGFAGVLKGFRPIEAISGQINWAREVPVALTRFVGVAELAGALGMVLPILTGALPFLTPLAAIGLSVVQIFAIGFHAMRGETAKSLPMNLVLLALSLFVAWGWWDLLV